MKRMIALFLIVGALLGFGACQSDTGEQKTKKNAAQTINYAQHMQAVWFSYYEIGEIFLSLNRQQAQNKCDEIFSSLSEKGINTVFFHVRAYADAFYDSKIFPRSKYSPDDYDLLTLAVEAAHRHAVSIHAWINPYRAEPAQKDALESGSIAAALYQKEKNALIFGAQSLYLNPGSIRVQNLILDGIRELLENYEIDGIHFDDYFYPADVKNGDNAGYQAYKKAGGNLMIEDYRRENITNLIAAAHVLIKAHNPGVLFGISPQASRAKNREELFADIDRWLALGCVDYVMPQIYFGFENEASPFEQTVNDWLQYMKGKQASLYVGLALYKSGKTDAYAGGDAQNHESAYYEWQNRHDIIARQIDFIRLRGIKGFSLFSYSGLEGETDSDALLLERENLLQQLKG